MTAPRLSRRAFLVAASAAIVGACTGGDDAGPDTFGAGAEIDDDFLVLQAGFADGQRAPSTLEAGRPERAPFVFFGAEGPVVNGLPAVVEVELTAPDGSVQTIAMPKHADGIPSPYYPLEFLPEVEGLYAMAVPIGDEVQVLEFAVAPRGSLGLVVPGEPMRPVDTPTFADPRGFDPVCTRFEPCPFHEHNLADVIGNGRPTALLIATPGFCQTVICGPVVDLLIELDPSATMNVIHAEIFTEPERINEVGIVPELLGPTVIDYAMDFEPSLVVADADGIVTARLDYTFDRTEMAAALATAT